MSRTSSSAEDKEWAEGDREGQGERKLGRLLKIVSHAPQLSANGFFLMLMPPLELFFRPSRSSR